jgi:Fusaric acid resistance protein-like
LQIAARSALSMAVVVAAGWATGDLSSGLVATIGAFTAVYASDRPYSNRSILLMGIALSFALVTSLGVWAQRRSGLEIPMIALIAMLATFFCHALRIGPPGGYMFALACAIGTGLPTSRLAIWNIALLVLGGGIASWMIQMSGFLIRPRGIEIAAVAASAKAVARFAEAPNRLDREKTCHDAALALHDSWAKLVSLQPAHPRPNRELTRLRALNRELHLLFAACINDADQQLGSKLGLVAARAKEIGIVAMRPEPTFDQSEPASLPLGHLDSWGMLRENLRPLSPGLIATVRVGIAVVITGGIGAAFGLEHSYWAMAAAVLVLHQGAPWIRTLQLGVERMVGTMAGLCLAGAILVAHPRGVWLIAVLMLLQFLVDLLVTRNYALAALFITAIALTVASGGRDVLEIGGLLWARGQETIIGCLSGLIVYVLTARCFLANSIRQETVRTIAMIQAVLRGIASAKVTTPDAMRARRDLQHGLLALVAAFETEMGGLPSNQNAAARLWPSVAATQRLGYKVLATCWSLEESQPERPTARGLLSPVDAAKIDLTLSAIANAAQFGANPLNLTGLPSFLQAEITALNSSLVHKEG